MLHDWYGGDQGIVRRMPVAPVSVLLRGGLAARLVVLRGHGGSGRAIEQVEVPRPETERLLGKRFLHSEIDEAEHGPRRPAQRRA